MEYFLSKLQKVMIALVGFLGNYTVLKYTISGFMKVSQNL